MRRSEEMMKTMHALTILLTTTALACGGNSGSGGGGGGNGNGDVATTEGGETITSSSGAAVNSRAHTEWVAGNEGFAAGEEQGWNESRCDDVKDNFEDAIDEQEDFAEAHYMLGLTLERCNEATEAREAYMAALRVDANMCKARVAVGLMDLAADNVSAARRSFQTAIDNDPRCTSGYTNLAIVQRQTSEVNSDQENEALRNLRRALAIESDYLPAFNHMALLYLERGRQRGGRAALDLAEVVCRQAQLNDRDYAPIYNTWGLVKMEKEEVNEALRYFQRALELDPNFYEAQMNFGAITLSFRGYSDARTAFTRATELRSNDYDATIGLGAAQRGLEQYPEAQATYERAIQIDGDRPEAYFNIGLIHHEYLNGQIPDLEQALNYYRQFVQKAGDNPTYAEAVENVTRRCRERQNQRRRRRGRNRMASRSGCQPGRIQLVEKTIELLREMETMQREAEALQRQAEAQAAAAEQQNAGGSEGASEGGDAE